MRIFRNEESSQLMGQKLISGIKWAKEILNRQWVKRKAKKNRRELLKLGQHLLKDLGFNSKGYPIKPNCHEKKDKCQIPATSGSNSQGLSNHPKP